MAKNMHLEERSNRKDEEGTMRQHAYMNVATALNEAVNRKNGGFGDDIDKREVAKMIDQMLDKKKGVVGKGGYMERATSGRITRGLKRMWEREPSFDYDGSLSEWNQWRKAKEEKRRSAADGVPKEGGTGTVVESTDKDLTKGASILEVRELFGETLMPSTEILGDIWRQVGAAVDAAPNRSALVNNATPARTPAACPTGNKDSFDRLPSHLRDNDKYAWANRTNRESHAGSSSNIDSYRPSYSSSTSIGRPHSSPLHESVRKIYRPPVAEPMSTPSVTHDYSSSPSKTSSYYGTARPTFYPGTARPTTAVLNPFEETNLVRAIQMAQRRSSPLKRSGLLKLQSNVNYHRNSALSEMISPARTVLFADPDVEMGEIVEERGGRTGGTKANGEQLPFNRLGERRESSGDTNKRDGES